MKILYAATEQDLGSIHGGTIHIQAVASELMQCGHDIHLLVQKNRKRSVEIKGIHLHEIPNLHRFMLWRAGAQIQQLLTELNPDLVMERYYNFSGEALIRSNKLGIPTVLEVNSPMIEYPGSLKSKIDALLLGSFKKRRERIAIAASLILSPMKEIVPDQHQNKVREIEWGADTKLFDPDSLEDRNALRSKFNFNTDEILLIHFGSLRKWHGVVKLLEAFDIARPKFTTPVQLIVVGPTTLTSNPQRQGVKFVGTIQHEELPMWLKISDLAIFPFAIEQHRYLELGFYWSPLKVFEAMAMSLPILTLNHERLIHLLGTDDPDFFYDGSTHDLSYKIESAVRKFSALKQKSMHFRQRVLEHYSWEVHGKTLNRWITELVAKER